jgi:hypothetical protein
MVMLREFANKIWPKNWSKWIWIGLAVVASALRFYYVQEMIAALMIFSVLFMAVP